MTIVYCDFLNGNDTTGDGSRLNPYKTITKASTGLTGGDEVRVAKSPDPINLAGTLSFTNGSTPVVATSGIFINEVSAGQTDGSVRLGDFVKGGDGNWWEVVSVTDSTHATLIQVYSGETASGVSSQKLGITSTGAAPEYATIQSVSASGTSSNYLKIRGGWNLSTDTQDGQSFFWQMDSANFSNRLGTGLALLERDYVQVERCHFLRYYLGLYLYDTRFSVFDSLICNSNGESGLQIYGYATTCPWNVFNSLVANCNGYAGIELVEKTHSNTFNSPTCNSNYEGVSISLTSSFNIFNNLTCLSNSDCGVYSVGYNNTFNSPVCNNNGYYGFLLRYGAITIINSYSGSGNVPDDIYVQRKSFTEFPIAKCQHFKTAGANKCFYESGTTERDTANARGGSGECLKYSPTSADYYISQSFYFKADSGVGQTLSAYVKKNSAFNGDVKGAIYFLGIKITGWTDITPSVADEYQQKSLTASANNITEDGVLELRIKVRGTAGNVFVDDLSTAGI